MLKDYCLKGTERRKKGKKNENGYLFDGHDTGKEYFTKNGLKKYLIVPTFFLPTPLKGVFRKRPAGNQYDRWI